MRLFRLVFAVLLIAGAGCDTISGIRREAKIHTLPDLQALKARIENYPEVKEVKIWHAVGGRPLKLTGIKMADELFYLSYTDHAAVHGTLMFTRDYRGDVTYSQYFFMLNRKPPQAWIDATWPVMKKIEQDLQGHFRFQEIPLTVQSRIMGVEHPERLKPSKEPEPATTAPR